MKESKEINEENWTDGKETSIGKRKRDGKFGKGWPKQFSDQRDFLINYQTSTHEEKVADKLNRKNGFEVNKFLFERVVKTSDNDREK